MYELVTKVLPEKSHWLDGLLPTPAGKTGKRSDTHEQVKTLLCQYRHTRFTLGKHSHLLKLTNNVATLHIPAWLHSWIKM